MNPSDSPTVGMRSSESKSPDSESKVPENLLAAGRSNPSSEPKALESDPEASDNVTPAEPSNPSVKDDGSGDQTEEKGEDADDDEEEEGECGFCLFMKAGGCKESFVAWENCIEEGENKKENIVEKCFEVTAALKKCMEAHSSYYEPVLRAEKAAEEELEREVAAWGAEKNNKEDDDRWSAEYLYNISGLNLGILDSEWRLLETDATYLAYFVWKNWKGRTNRIQLYHFRHS